MQCKKEDGEFSSDTEALPSPMHRSIVQQRVSSRSHAVGAFFDVAFSWPFAFKKRYPICQW